MRGELGKCIARPGQKETEINLGNSRHNARGELGKCNFSKKKKKKKKKAAGLIF
jgi:hypothetical protein